MTKITDFIDSFLDMIGFRGSTAKAVQFVIGLGIVTFCLVKFNEINPAVAIIGILFGGYLILKSIQ